MPIAKKPQRSTAASGQGGDRAAEAFISAAGKPDTSEEVAESRKTPVMIRFDRALLERWTRQPSGVASAVVPGYSSLSVGHSILVKAEGTSALIPSELLSDMR